MLLPDLEFDLHLHPHPGVGSEFALMATNPSLELVHWNAGAERLLGFSREEALGCLPFEVFMTPEDFSTAADYCSQLISAPAPEVELWARYRARTRSGGGIDCDWYHQRVYQRDTGALLLVLCLVVPQSSHTKQAAYQAVVDQYARRVQRWVDEREQRWQTWHRLFNERCSAVRFDRGLYAELTPRERELVEELCRSLRLKLVARKLGISLHTARNHLKSVFAKLHVHSQEQLIRDVKALHASQHLTPH